MQRFEELKFLISMETDPGKKEACIETIRAFIKQGQELVVTNFCDTSSDEDETREIVSDVTKSSIETSTTSQDYRRNQRRLLPGIIEKWNSDVSDEEVKDADNESDNEDIESSDNNQGDDQSSDGTRSEEEDDGNRGRNDDNSGKGIYSDSDSGVEPDEGSTTNPIVDSTTESSVSLKGNRRNPRMQEEESKANRSGSTTSYPQRIFKEYVPPNSTNSSYSSQVKTNKAKDTRVYKEDTPTNRTNSTNSSKSSQVKTNNAKDTRAYEENTPTNRTKTTNHIDSTSSSNSCNSSNSSEVKTN